jgi:hypothetical protein
VEAPSLPQAGSRKAQDRKHEGPAPVTGRGPSARAIALCDLPPHPGPRLWHPASLYLLHPCSRLPRGAIVCTHLCAIDSSGAASSGYAALTRPTPAHISARWIESQGGQSRSDCPPLCSKKTQNCRHHRRIREQSSLPQVSARPPLEVAPSRTQRQTASPASWRLQGYSASSAQMPAKSCRSELYRGAFPQLGCVHTLAREGLRCSHISAR